MGGKIDTGGARWFEDPVLAAAATVSSVIRSANFLSAGERE